MRISESLFELVLTQSEEEEDLWRPTLYQANFSDLGLEHHVCLSPLSCHGPSGCLHLHKPPSKNIEVPLKLCSRHGGGIEGGSGIQVLRLRTLRFLYDRCLCGGGGVEGGGASADAFYF